MKKLTRVLIANRGEIAVRIIRALRDLNIESVAIYSDADRYSQHVTMADFAVNLPGQTSTETYLNIPRLIEIIKATKADGVHPGYGFLAENSDFAEAVGNLGVKFIGPSVASMKKLGDKIQARSAMIENNVPIVPGVQHPLKDYQDLKKVTDEIGFPVILKAAAGGGGRGMRIVRKDEELQNSLEACQREAVAYFGNGDVFCERYIENPRHIEFQVLFDSHGNGVHLFERDCSVQRRHQKLFEEAPSAFLNSEQREKLGHYALTAARAANYEGVGTVEFICESPDKAYFMEMNTRIQVEHPVTEMITNIDLITEQIKVACGEKLSVTQADIVLHGWSMETRINAEDPAKGFLPSPGVVKHLRFPSGPFVRVDSHLYPGYEIPQFYDSMIAKIIVWGKDRNEAIARMKRCLSELEVQGVPTTAKFHSALLKNESFLSGHFNTSLIETEWDYFQSSMNTCNELSEEEKALVATVLTLEKEGNHFHHESKHYRENWKHQAKLEGVRKN